MTRSTATPTTTSATPTETFSDLMSKFSIISPSSDLTWKQKETPAEYSFDATSFVSQQVMSPVKRDSELTDYKLERDKTQLFPDFYYQFVKNFSKKSCVNAAYCDRDVAAFKATFEGSENDIRRVVAHVKNDFATAFRQSLGESFDEEYETTFFDRFYVENQFVRKMIELKEWPAIGIRQNAVIGKALSGDIKPYVWFLRAYNSTDEEIWAQIYPLLIKGCSTRQDVKTFQKNMEKLQAKDGNIIDNMKEFVECLESKDIFTKRQKRGRPQLKAPKDRDFPVQDRKSASPTKQGGGPPKLQKKWNGEKGPASGANPGVNQGKPEGNTTAEYSFDATSVVSQHKLQMRYSPDGNCPQKIQLFAHRSVFAHIKLCTLIEPRQRGCVE